MENTNASRPPAPWLGTAAGEGAPLQSWSLGVRPGVYLVARYDFHPVEYRRCRLRQLRNFVLLLCWIGAAMGFITALIPLLMAGLTSSTSTRILTLYYPTFLWLGIVVAVIYPVFAGTTMAFGIYANSLMWQLLPKKETVLVADANGVSYETALSHLPDGTRCLKWRRMRGVLYENGDIQFLSRFGDKAFYVPRSAFADAAAGERFAAAATALWEARGNIAEVNPGILDGARQ